MIHAYYHLRRQCVRAKADKKIVGLYELLFRETSERFLPFTPLDGMHSKSFIRTFSKKTLFKR
jgi:hypothetical protein